MYRQFVCIAMFISTVGLFTLSCFAQETAARNPAADAKRMVSMEEWLGSWEGEVRATAASGVSKSFRMQLRVEPTEVPGRWDWQISYSGDQGESLRRYLLIADDSDSQRFVIDEQNGIRIDATLLDQSLISIFSVDRQHIWSSYRFEKTASGKQIYFELISASLANSSTTGGHGEVPSVESLKTQSRQVATLKWQPTDESVPGSIEMPAWKKLETEAYRGKQDDLCFVDEYTGWYANGAGKIFKTVDGGLTWEKQLEQPGTFFRCLAFLDERHGFAGNIGTGYFPNVTDTHPLYKTQDGGKSWQAVTPIDGEPVVGLCALQVLKEEFINAGKLETRTRLIGVGRVGGPTAMIVSDDLGKSWQQLDIRSDAAMALDVYFFNRNEGFIAAATNTDVSQSNALVLATKDGGKSWKNVWQSKRPYELAWKMSFPSRRIGYVTIQSYNPDNSVAERFVAKTSDGGENWSELPLVVDANVREFGIGFLNENVGWVGAVPTGFATVDGGQSWRPVEMGNAVNKIRVLKLESKSVGFAIGTNIYRIDIPATLRGSR